MALRRSPTGRARSLGASGEGTGHWFGQQIAAISLIPLSLYVLTTFMLQVVLGNGYESALAWMQNPLNAIAMILMLTVGIIHGANGVISGLIEDYVHHRGLHLLGLLIIKFTATLTLIAGVLAVLKIMLGA